MNKDNYELVTNWYQNYYLWQSGFMMGNYLNALPSTPAFTHRAESEDQCLRRRETSTSTFVHENAATRPAAAEPTRHAPALHRHIYKVPPLYKRLLAELCDSIYIQFCKIIILIIIINYTDIVDDGFLKFFDLLEDIFNGSESSTSLNLPFEILFLEIVYVMISVIFETVSLYTKGYTLGKYLFNLKVISCNNINENLFINNTIEVIPGTELSIKSTLIRSLLKNFSIILFFPTIVFFLLPAFAEYGQTSYDKAAKTIVVEIV